MIEVTGTGTGTQERPRTLEGVYELLEPYHLRTVRLKFSAQRYDERWGRNTTTNSRSMGRLVGLRVSSMTPYGRNIRSSDTALTFFFEGQPPENLLWGEFSVDVLQEDTQEWSTVYDSKAEEASR